MKKLLMSLCIMLVAFSSMAAIETGDNMMGFYFDEEADLPFTYNAPYGSIHTMYLVLINPTFNNLYGFEFGYSINGVTFILSTTYTNPQTIDVGSAGNHIVGFGAPTPMLSINILATLTMIYMDPSACEPVEFTMSGTSPSSINPLYPTLVLEDSELISAGVSSWPGFGDITSAIYGDCTVGTTSTSFDSLKSLYR